MHVPPFLQGLITPQASFIGPLVTRVRSNREAVVILGVVVFFLNKPPNIDALVVVVGLYPDGVVVETRAEIESEVGFFVVVFPFKKRLMVSITSLNT